MKTMLFESAGELVAMKTKTIYEHWIEEQPQCFVAASFNNATEDAGFWFLDWQNFRWAGRYREAGGSEEDRTGLILMQVEGDLCGRLDILHPSPKQQTTTQLLYHHGLLSQSSSRSGSGHIAASSRPSKLFIFLIHSISSDNSPCTLTP